MRLLSELFQNLVGSSGKFLVVCGKLLAEEKMLSLLEIIYTDCYSDRGF